MNQIRLAFGRIFKPYNALKQFSRLGTPFAHHELRNINRLVMSHKFQTRCLLLTSFLLFQQSIVDTGFKKLHQTSRESTSSVHVLQMNNQFDDVETIVTDLDRTEDTLFFQEIGVIKEEGTVSTC